MRQKEKRLVRGAVFTGLAVLLILGAASCGKKTVAPEKRSEESGAESDSTQADSTESGGTESDGAGSGRAESGGSESGNGKFGDTKQGTQSAGQGEEQETQALPETGRAGRLAGGSTAEVIYEVKVEEKQYTAEDGTPIFQLSLAYPQLLGKEAGAEKINAYMGQWAKQKLAGYEGEENSTKQSALEVYRESKDSGWKGPWGERYELESVKSWNGYLSILADSYLFERGLPEMPYRENFVFRLSDGERVELSEITALRREDWDRLLRVRFAEAISEGEAGDFYENALDQIKVRDMGDVGYFFTDTGITFYLPPYEIAPWSTGYVEVEIPFWEIEARLRTAAGSQQPCIICGQQQVPGSRVSSADSSRFPAAVYNLRTDGAY